MVHAGTLALLLLLLLLLLSTPTRQAGTSCPRIVPRARWGASAATAVHYIAFPVAEVVVGHTAGPACASATACARQVYDMQQHHIKALDYGDIAYSFLIGGDGLVFEGRGWHKRGAHTYGYNSRSIGVAFIGDFSDTGASSGQLAALRALLRCGVELGELTEDVQLYGQRQVQSTESPGLALYQQLQDLSEWVEAVPEVPAAPSAPSAGTADGVPDAVTEDAAVSRVHWRSAAHRPAKGSDLFLFRSLI